MKDRFSSLFILTALVCLPAAADVVFENSRCRLTVAADAMVKSLVLKATGEECVPADESVPLFSVTQDRPFNNEVKLIHPNKCTTYQANAIRRECDRLIVGFETAPYEAVVEVKLTDSYVEFKLADFLVDKEDYDYLQMDVPPVASFRVLQLPVRNRANFGDWLNASWDEKSAVGVVGTSPYTDIDHEDCKGFRILSGDLVRGQKLKGGSAALIVANGREDFLDCMDRMERDFDLPLGVESRRSDAVNAFIYHVAGNVTQQNIDRHLYWAKRGGFSYMTFDTHNFTKTTGSWGLHGDYDWNAAFANGAADVRALLAKVKAAGLHPGLHFLHTHIGLKSRYVTPVADPRLNKTRRFTLAAPLPATTNVTTLEVFEPTADVTLFAPCRVLQFGGELVSYESYTREPPYRFLGVKRGAWNTTVTAHPRGEVGGILDISEFGEPMSCYLDQNSDLQDEVAAKISAIYNCGFEYAYFDGSEGVNRPFNFHVSNAQYRQWKLFEPKPLFSEGAAKTHFDWHILTGANAFDCFPPETFKRNIVRFPVAQAPLSWQDMTRVNFGWWKYFKTIRPHHWQFACSQCLAWGCPATVLVNPDVADATRENAEACFEVMRRWEEARKIGLLTAEQKEMLKDTSRSFRLDRRADGTLVLCEDGVSPLPAKPADADVRVEGEADVKVEDDVVTVRSSGEVSFVRIFWPMDLPRETRVLNDAWERSYGNLAWKDLSERRFSPWYFLASVSNRIWGVGVETGPGAMCCWEVATNGVTLVLDVRAGGRPVRLGGRKLKACRIVRAESVPGETAWQFGRRFCKLMCPWPRLPKTPVYGYNDWYCAYGNNTATNFLADAEYIMECAKGCVNKPYVVIDDGWQKNAPPIVHESGRGPWDASGPSFGMDMPTFCQKIVALGAKPGLWYRPLRAWDELPDAQRLLACRDYLDPTVPTVRERIVEDMRRFREWGFKLVKIDFLSYDLAQLWPSDAMKFADRYIQDDRAWRDSRRTTAEVTGDLYRAMKDAVGDDVVIIGCNAFNHLAAGVFELQRTGNDTSGKDWSWTRKNGVNTLAMRSVQDGAFFKVDADCVGLASAGAVPWTLNRQWIDLLSRSGTPFFVSWRRQLAGPEVRAALVDAFRRASSVRPVAEPLDWMSTFTPSRWRDFDGETSYDWGK